MTPPLDVENGEAIDLDKLEEVAGRLVAVHELNWRLVAEPLSVRVDTSSETSAANREWSATFDPPTVLALIQMVRASRAGTISDGSQAAQAELKQSLSTLKEG